MSNKLLKDWATLNQHIMSLSEDKLRKLLEEEQKGANRLSLILRIQGRINKLAARREREARIKEQKK